jgi:hypothetical protein
MRGKMRVEKFEPSFQAAVKFGKYDTKRDTKHDTKQDANGNTPTHNSSKLKSKISSKKGGTAGTPSIGSVGAVQARL